MKRTPVIVLAAATLSLAVPLWTSPRPSVDAAPNPRSTELRILGSSHYRPGVRSCLRIISYDAASGKPVADVPVQVHLEGGHGASRVLFSGRTNTDGTVDGSFIIPSDAPESAAIKVTSPLLGTLDLSAPVTIQEDDRLYLTTDKPLYQPGQTVHVRLLGLKAPDLSVLGNRACQVQISDPRGNVVFKSSPVTSKFGVLSARFDLASEVNMGEYHLVATCGRARAEKSFTVKRYVLPKFKVGVTTDKAYYQPADKVHGHVHAAYFFGKPVAHGHVVVHIKTFDTSDHELEQLEGTTNENGDYSFDVALPQHFTGRPLDRGQAPLDILAEVVDTANHKELGPLALSVVSNPISVELFPESGSLLPNLSNRVYVLSTYPDGKAAPCRVTVKIGTETRTLATDATGFGTFDYTPKLQAAPAVYGRGLGASMPYGEMAIAASLLAVDSHGNQAHLDASLAEQGQSESVLVRVDKALYRVGDTLHADVYSTRSEGTVYLDVLREGQTISTRAADLHDHRASLDLALTPDVSGSISLHAYQIGSDQNVIRDVRRLFVQPARNLQVEVHLDKSTYQPGQDARLTFLVKTPQGAPRLAVLGVDLVDESLFSLAERQPGLEKVYFLLEQAMLDPKYEVHGFSLSDAVKNPESDKNAAQQNLTRASLSRMDRSEAEGLSLDTYSLKVQATYQQLQKVQTAVYTWSSQHRGQTLHLQDLVSAHLVGASDIIDAWGHELLYRNGMISSAGPDGRPDTSDDITMQQQFGGRMRGMDLDRAGGVVMEERAMAMPVPANAATAPVLQKAEREAAPHAQLAGSGGAAPAQAPVRVREYFPETLYTNPEVVTDENGRASITVPLADSITTWRLSAFASSVHGELGNAAGQVKVFQPFFVDVDMPAALTQNDEISIPVAVYNYLPSAQDVTLKLDSASWFKPLDGVERTLHLTRNQVSVVYYRIRTSGLGTQRMTVRATGTEFSDAVRRTVLLEPDGEAVDSVTSDRLAGVVHRSFTIPKDAVPGASKLLLTIYPGVFAQVMEGMDAIFRMPNGCFEQTSSTTYPNVLVMDYLKKLHRLTPETQMKAEGFINTGYQRLLTFEVKGGGFSVFGQAPANPILTAYGLMEFADMARVHDIDPNLVDRTKSWLLAAQRPDGAWGSGREGFYAEGWSNVPNSDLVATSYITWALLNTGDRSPRVMKAVAYVREHMGQATEPYTSALVANTLVTAHDELSGKALAHLAAMEVQDKDVVYWRTQIATAAFGTGAAGDIETTALAALAMEGDANYTDQVNKAMTYLTRSKDRNGTWQSTQATVLAMKALVGSIDRASENTDASVQMRVNGKSLASLHITRETSDVFRQVDLTPLLHTGTNDVDISLDGKGNCQYKLAGTVYRPWSDGGPKDKEPLHLTVAYDRTHLGKDDTAECTVQVQNLTPATANQVVVDVGVPPGFDVHEDDLSALVEKHVIAKFSNTGRQLIIYFEKLDPSSTATLRYQVKARYPLRAQAPSSDVYEYYDPSRHTSTHPVPMEVR